MGLTERENRILAASKPGDIVPFGNQLIRINVFDEVTGRVGGFVLGCEWFAQCANDAESLIPHPIIGYVPTCVRCAAPAL